MTSEQRRVFELLQKSDNFSNYPFIAMNKTIKIYLSVKFRAFGITFGTMKEAWEIDLNNLANPFSSIPFSEAPTGNKLYDKQGIKLIVGIVNPL